MNTARAYTGIAASRAKETNERDPTRPGSVKKQKQQRKQQDSVLARQNELGQLVAKLEDRDTQQQAFTSLLELLPTLDAALVRDLYARLEKNKAPGRSSTRRMVVLVLAALCKCHAASSARLLPRILPYMSLRLRDKEAQITDACAILCSAIALYVVPYASVNSDGSLSPRKANAAMMAEDPTKRTDSLTDYQPVFDAIVSHLAKETNAVGGHATKCIASVINPVDFNGTSAPPIEAARHHGHRILGFLTVFFASLVSKLNESRQFTSYSSAFSLLQAIVSLAKTLHSGCEDGRVFELVLGRLSDLVDAIEDVFRSAPREDWLLRKRGIELWSQLLDLFVLGGASKNDTAWGFVDRHFERIQRIVGDARHDPVSAVRDAALPAVFQLEQLTQLLPRGATTAMAAAPVSPFRRVYHHQVGGGTSNAVPLFSSRGGANQKPLTTIRRVAPPPLLPRGDRLEVEHTNEAVHVKEDRVEEGGGGGEGETEGGGDEAVAPEEGTEEEEERVHAEADSIPASHTEPRVPPLALTSAVTPVAQSTTSQPVPRLQQRAGSDRRAIPRQSSTRKQRHRDWNFQPLPVDDAQSDEAVANQVSLAQEDSLVADSDGDHAAPPPSSQEGDIAQDPPPRFDTTAHPSTAAAVHESEDPSTWERDQLSPSEAAILAAVEGEAEVALRLVFVEDDATLLRKVLALTPRPCMAALSRASRCALCAAFLELLDEGDDSHDVWVVFAWLEDLCRHRRLVQQLDPRVLRAIERRLNTLAETASEAGQVAADLLTKLGL